MIRKITKDQADALKAKATRVDDFINVRLVEVYTTTDRPLVFIHEGDRILLVEQGEADFL